MKNEAMPETTPQLSESEVNEIEARQERAEAKYMAVVEGKQWWRETGTPTSCIGESLEDIPALIRDWRALRAENATLKKYWADTSEDLASAWVKHEEQEQSNAALREQLAAAREALTEISVKKYEEFAFGQCVGIAKNTLRELEKTK